MSAERYGKVVKVDGKLMVHDPKFCDCETLGFETNLHCYRDLTDDELQQVKEQQDRSTPPHQVPL